MAFADTLAAVDRAVQDHLGSVEIVYAPTVGAPVTVPAMFDPNFVLSDQGTGAVEQVTASVFVLLADLPIDPEDDDAPTITVAGVDYVIWQRVRDPVGRAIRLLLHRKGA